MAIFTLASETVFIEFTLPLKHAEAIIQGRQHFARSIREKIEVFDCVNCPKDCGEIEMRLVDGVKLCTGRAEARRIYAVLSDPDEFASIHDVLNITLGAAV